MTNKVSETFEKIIPAYVILLTVLYYFFERSNSDLSAYVFLGYSSAIGSLYIYYFVSIYTNFSEKEIKFCTFILNLSFLFMALSIFSLGYITVNPISETLIEKIFANIVIQIPVLTLFYVALLPIFMLISIVFTRIKN